MSPNNSGDAIAGGPRADMQTTLGGRFSPRYRQNDELSVRRQELRELWAETAKKLRPYARTRKEYLRVTDAIGGQISGPLLDLMVELDARAEMPGALEEFGRAAVVNRVAFPAPPCVFEASELEQRSNEPLNQMQLVATKERTPVRWGEVASLAWQQIRATVALFDAAKLASRRTA